MSVCRCPASPRVWAGETCGPDCVLPARRAWAARARDELAGRAAGGDPAKATIYPQVGGLGPRRYFYDLTEGDLVRAAQAVDCPTSEGYADAGIHRPGSWEWHEWRPGLLRKHLTAHGWRRRPSSHAPWRVVWEIEGTADGPPDAPPDEGTLCACLNDGDAGSPACPDCRLPLVYFAGEPRVCVTCGRGVCPVAAE